MTPSKDISKKIIPGFINFHLRSSHMHECPWPDHVQHNTLHMASGQARTIPFILLPVRGPWRSSPWEVAQLCSLNPSLHVEPWRTFFNCLLEKSHTWGETEGKCHTSSISSFQENSSPAPRCIKPLWGGQHPGGQRSAIFFLPMWIQRVSWKTLIIVSKQIFLARGGTVPSFYWHTLSVSVCSKCRRLEFAACEEWTMRPQWTTVQPRPPNELEHPNTFCLWSGHQIRDWA